MFLLLRPRSYDRFAASRLPVVLSVMVAMERLALLASTWLRLTRLTNTPAVSESAIRYVRVE